MRSNPDLAWREAQRAAEISGDWSAFDRLAARAGHPTWRTDQLEAHARALVTELVRQQEPITIGQVIPLAQLFGRIAYVEQEVHNNVHGTDHWHYDAVAVEESSYYERLVGRLEDDVEVACAVCEGMGYWENREDPCDACEGAGFVPDEDNTAVYDAFFRAMYGELRRQLQQGGHWSDRMVRERAISRRLRRRWNPAAGGPSGPDWDPERWLAEKFKKLRSKGRQDWWTEPEARERLDRAAEASEAARAAARAELLKLPPRRICLVSCSGPKLDHPAPARDLYTSRLFRKSRAFAERRCDDWAILSARYGLVLPDQVIEPYDQRLPGRQEDRRIWGQGVANKLTYHFRPQDTFVILAGADYADALPEEILRRSEQPLRGVHPVGRRERWLEENPHVPGHDQGQCPTCGKDLGPYRGFGIPRRHCSRRCQRLFLAKESPEVVRAASKRRRTAVRGRICRFCGASDKDFTFGNKADVCSKCTRQRQRAGSCPGCDRPLFQQYGEVFCSYCPGRGKVGVVFVSPSGRERRGYVTADAARRFVLATGVPYDELVLDMPSERSFFSGSFSSAKGHTHMTKAARRKFDSLRGRRRGAHG